MKLVRFNSFHDSEVARKAVMEERNAEIAKQNRFQPVMEKIRLCRSRNMSEGEIIRIYGAEAVQLERESRLPSGNDKSDEVGSEAVIGSISPIKSATAPLSAIQARMPDRRRLANA